MNRKYCCTIDRHGKYRVYTIGPCGDLKPMGNVREFISFEEGNQVARAIARGEYGYTPGEFVNMR